MARRVDYLGQLTRRVYEGRRDRAVNPEGDFDAAGRWYPSDREDAGGDGSSTRCPSRPWPYSYMLRCRTRQHCRVLVERALRGLDVPADVAAALRDAELRAGASAQLDALAEGVAW